MSKVAERYEYVKELAEEFECEYPNPTEGQIADYVAICDMSALEVNYFMDLISH